MKALATLAAVAALTTAAFAETSAETESEPTFNVIEADVSVPFATIRIRGFHVAPDNSLILRAGPTHWYRATLWNSCARELRWVHERIALDLYPSGRLDRFSEVIVRGRRCPIQSLDRIERPAPGAGG